MKPAIPNTEYKMLNTGFTLIELLVVIAIIGILAAIGLVSFRSSQIRSQDAERKSDLRQMANAFELFYSDYEVYPPSDGGGNLVACPYSQGGSVACAWGSSEFTDSKTTYFQKLPKDPSGSDYYYVSDGESFKLYARLQNTQDPSYINDYGVSCGSANCNFGVSSTNTTP